MGTLDLMKLVLPLLAAAAGIGALVTDFRKDGVTTRAGKWALAGVVATAIVTIVITTVSSFREAHNARLEAEQLRQIIRHATSASSASQRAAGLSQTAALSLNEQLDTSKSILDGVRSAVVTGRANLVLGDRIRTQTLRNLYPLRRLELGFVARFHLAGAHYAAYLQKLEHARQSTQYEPFFPIVGAEQRWFHAPPQSGAVAGDFSEPPLRMYFFENSPAFPSKDGDVMVEQLGRAFNVTVRFYVAANLPKVNTDPEILDKGHPPDLKVTFSRRPEDDGHTAILYDSKQKAVELHARWLVREQIHPAWQALGTLVSLPDLRNGLMTVQADWLSSMQGIHLGIRIDGALFLDSDEDLRPVEVMTGLANRFSLYSFRFPNAENLAAWAQQREAQRERQTERKEKEADRIYWEKYRAGLCDPGNILVTFVKDGLTSPDAEEACQRDLHDSKVPKGAVWNEDGLYTHWEWDHRKDGKVLVQCSC